MNAELLLSYYEQIADAPDAVVRLRRFILDLAVRGKLVLQDPSDEPASELLKRIEKEKTRVNGRSKAFSRVQSDEMAFQVPANWEWVRIRQVTSDRGQSIPDQDFTYIDVTAINKELGYIADAKVVSAGDAPSRARKLVSKGDVLYSCVRPYLLNIAIVENDITPAPIASTAFAVLNGFGLVLPKYQWIVLRSPFMVACVEEKMRGQAYPAINDADFALLPFALPPLAEQRRIVARVDELMALCDQLEQARAEREARRDRLAAATLARLSQPADEPREFREDAAFALEQLAAITARPEQVKALRQAIMNLAVRGKLVAQDAKDESASELLMLGQVEARRPDDIPSTWNYVRLADILAEDTRNGYSRRPDDVPNGTPILRISAGTVRTDGVVAEEEHKLISGIDDELRHQYRLEPGDLLACRFNGNKAFVGRLTIFTDYLGLKPIYPDKLIRVRVAPRFAVPAFLRLAGDSDLVRTEVEAFCATTVGNWGISASNLKEVRFPLPPLAEQRRIVAKVDELMALCDQLEASLAAGAGARRRLLDAVLSAALEPATAGGEYQARAETLQQEPLGLE